MLSSKSKKIRKPKIEQSKKWRKARVTAPQIGNPDLLLDHFTNRNLAPNQDLPGLKFDQSANRYYSAKKLQEEEKVKQDTKKMEEKMHYKEMRNDPRPSLINISALSLINKSRIMPLSSNEKAWYSLLLNSSFGYIQPFDLMFDSRTAIFSYKGQIYSLFLKDQSINEPMPIVKSATASKNELILCDLTTFEFSPLSLLRLHKVCFRYKDNQPIAYILYKVYREPPQVLKVKLIPEKSGFKTEIAEQSQIDLISVKRWPKHLRSQYLSELFKCYILRKRYFPKMLKILSKTRARVNALRYDIINNVLVVGYKRIVEVWSLRKECLCKKYELEVSSGTVADVEVIISHSTIAMDYRIAVRLSDWTVLDIYDPDLRVKEGKNYCVKAIYELTKSGAKNYNPSYGLCYIRRYNVLVYPRVNDGIGIYSVENGVNKAVSKEERKGTNEYKYMYNQECDFVWIYNSIVQIAENINF